MSERANNFIAGQWVSSVSDATFDSFDPATGQLVGRCADSSAADVDRAVTAAREAFDGWRRRPAPRRADILQRLADLLESHKSELGRWITREMGKISIEAEADVQEAIDMARYMAGEGRRCFGHTVPSELPDKFAMSLREPLGVAGIITPWNFPVAVPSWKILPALALGNTLVWKPSPETPVCAAKFTAVFEQAGLPPGALNLVLAGGADAGEALVRHPRVRLISFTGSNATGQRVATAAAETGKRCALELGGKNAILVMDDADLDLAVDGILWSAFGTSGQRCTACSRVIVHRDARQRLTDALLERTKRLKIGNGRDPATEIGPVINAAAVERIDRYVRLGVEEGARLLTGGEPYRKGDCAAGWFYRPTVFDEVTPRMRIAQEEIFGPVLCLIQAGNLDEAIAINNDVPYGLVSSIYTQNINRAFTAMRELTTGIVYVNAGTTGSEVQLPFGGTRATGNGAREAGQAALDTFSEWKTVYVDYSGRLQRAQIDTERS
jgi:acyl-CoA reductase-like NAD-dependent aldehyde dehydrogenase